MIKELRRTLAGLLALCMCMTVFAGLTVHAEEMAVGKAYPSSFTAGHVFELVDLTDQQAGCYRLDVGAYNFNQVRASVVHLNYDVNVVDLYKYDLSGKLLAPLFTADSGIKSGNYTADIAEYMNENGKELGSNGKVSWLQSQMFEYTTTGGATSADTTSGVVNTNLAMKDNSEVATYKDFFNEGVITGDGTNIKYGFNAGEGKTVRLYSLYFKVKDSQSLSPETFTLNTTVDENCTGGCQFLDINANGIQNGSAQWIGFPKAAAVTYGANFTVTSSSDVAINQAEVKVYGSESDRTAGTNEIAGATTDGAGIASIAKSDGNYFEVGVPYFYKITATGFVEQTGQFEVTNGTVEIKEKLTSEAEKTYPITFTVKDGDNRAALSGATVTIDGVAQASATDASGQVTANLRAGSHQMSASLSGYKATEAKAFTVEANADHSGAVVSAFEIQPEPERAIVKLPVPKDPEGNEINGAEITVTRTSSNETAAWGNGKSETYTYNAATKTFTDSKGKSYAASNGVEVPKTSRFDVEYGAPNYTGGGTVYLEEKDGSSTYYTDNSYAEGVKIADITAYDTTMTAMDDPMYKVAVTQDSVDASKFTAVVSLRNIRALNGTFGLRYDSEVFGLDTSGGTDAANNGFQLNATDLELWTPAQGLDNGKAVSVSDGSGSTVGYHTFLWQGKEGVNGGVFDALSEKEVATYTFHLKEGKTVQDISKTTFYVEAYDLTKAGAEAISKAGSYDLAYTEVIKDLWRYTDAENGTHENPEEDTLTSGRLHYTKATGGGFYQVYAPETNGGAGNEMYDVITDIEYTNFTATKASLTFQVKDESGSPLAKAKVHLYKSSDFTDGVLNEGAKPEILVTDEAGVYTRQVDASSGNITYGYSLDEYGYWTYPKETQGAADAGKDITTTVIQMGAASKTENITLKTRVYHEVKLLEEDGSTAVTTAATSGAKYAYNGVDYVFNIKPTAGNKYEAPVPNQVKVETDAGTFTVKYDKEKKVYTIPAEKITGTGTADPVLEGFPGNPIKILISKDTIQPDTSKYTITATAGENGKVSIPSASPAPTPVSGTLTEEVTAGGNSHELVFTPDEGYRVNKVTINGGELPSSAYTEDAADHSVKYTFEKVSANQNITVVFGLYDPEQEPPVIPNTKEATVSVSVGPYGSVEVTAPESGMTPAKSVVAGGSTQSFVIDTTSGNAKFVLTATPEEGSDPVYVVDKVTIKDEAGTVITPNGTYGFTPEAEKSYNVYVSFKTENGPSITHFVDSKVGSKEGSGSILPAGVQICSTGDAPEFTLTAGTEDWKTGKVDVNGTEAELKRLETVTYQIPPVSGDTTVTGYFVETSYQVKGVVDLSGGASGNEFENVPLSGATVTFQRKSDGAVVEVTTGRDRKNAGFTAELPQGVWDVTVSKRGYLKYEITGYEVTPGMNEFFGAPKGETATAAKPIMPLIGDTSGRGLAVSFSDAGAVANGLRSEATKAGKEKADVNDDGLPTISDMTYIKNNYGLYYTQQTYADFSDGWSGVVTP